MICILLLLAPELRSCPKDLRFPRRQRQIPRYARDDKLGKFLYVGQASLRNFLGYFDFLLLRTYNQELKTDHHAFGTSAAGAGAGCPAAGACAPCAPEVTARGASRARTGCRSAEGVMIGF